MASVFRVQIVGTALNSQGFTAHDAISGVGLNTFGFLWDAGDIWTDCCVTVTTVWTPSEVCDEDIA